MSHIVTDSRNGLVGYTPCLLGASWNVVEGINKYDVDAEFTTMVILERGKIGQETKFLNTGGSEKTFPKKSQ